VRVKAYYQTLKPERTAANVITTVAGFLLACRWHIEWPLLLATVSGTTLVVLSACAANNCTDRGIDACMPRTKNRVLVTGVIPVRNVALLAILCGVTGFGILILAVNWLTVVIGALAYFDYVVLYAWSKRHTPYSTLIGTISGAAPLVAGYTAVTGQFTSTALLLGLLMIFWQMPHFYAIGIFRRADYSAAKLPIWPVKYGIRNTQIWMLIYTVLYLVALLLLAAIGSVGLIGSGVLAVLAAYWLFKGMQGFTAAQPEKWARGIFGFSLIMVIVLSVALPLGAIAP